MTELLKKSLSIIVLILAFSCTVSAPIIREYEWDITLIEDVKNDIIYEKLSIFVNCYDDDGENDIETIFFIDDRDGIYWELTEDVWDTKHIDDVKWIGASNILMPDRSAIPRAVIRIFVRDLAGESVEDKLYITKKPIDTEDMKFPELIKSDQNYSISNYDNGILQIVTNEKIVAEGEITQAETDFKEIFGKSRVEYDWNAKFYIEVKDRDLTIRSGPWD